MAKRRFEVVDLAVKTALRVADLASVAEPTADKLLEGTLRNSGWTRAEYEAEQVRRAEEDKK